MQAYAEPGKGSETLIILLYTSVYSILLMYHLVSALLAYYIPLLKEQLSMFYSVLGKLFAPKPYKTKIHCRILGSHSNGCEEMKVNHFQMHFFLNGSTALVGPHLFFSFLIYFSTIGRTP
jgi:hypothetical protein